MGSRVIIIGAGIIGAAIAAELAKSGQSVTVIDAAAGPASGASGRSFGWINASYSLSDAHFHLRFSGMDAWRRWHSQHPTLSIAWPGCLYWLDDCAELAKTAEQLQALGYPIERVGADEFAVRAPAIGPVPQEALFFPGEGAAEAGQVAAQLLELARSYGACVVTGTRVENIAVHNGRVQGVQVKEGVLKADRVVVAAGNDNAALLASLDVPLPMLRRPGAMVVTRPTTTVLNHVMASPELELRQTSDGRILAPAAADHQADESETLSSDPETLANDTISRLNTLLPGTDLEWESVTQALRPVPGDGLPVVGHTGPDGLYLAVMHSGVTLAAIIAESVAGELSGSEASHLLAEFRPDRFREV